MTQEATDRREDVLRFVERFALVMRQSGIPPMPARVLAFALADDADRYTAADLQEALGVSAAAVSGAVRFLVQARLLRRDREPGTRSDLYVVDDADLWSPIFAGEVEQLGVWADVVAEGVEAVGADTPGGRRLRESQEFFAYMRGELPRLLEGWRAHREAHRHEW
ncbi:GbsR/MarR family transcriptional regulator [Aquipuribacter sp. SD81]|uniref:GbsR/MarR family transcriptional regulator n=1 Tax=Aquipuribacter sp. SD81 TaxID=3127703 RepID=UPI003016B821